MFFAPVETRRCVYYPHYLHRNHPLTHDLFQSQTSPWPCSVYQTLHFFSGFIRLPRGQLKAVAKSSEFWSVPITLKGKWLEFKKLLKCLWKKSSSSFLSKTRTFMSQYIYSNQGVGYFEENAHLYGLGAKAWLFTFSILYSSRSFVHHNCEETDTSKVNVSILATID